MSTSREAAWSKYFRGKGDIQTVLKKPAPVFDAAKPTSKIADLPAGTPIVYIASPKYEAKALIQYNKTKTKAVQVRVAFDMIAKPGVKSSGAASLKPQGFGIRDRKYSMSEYKNTVKNAIEENDSLTGELRVYLAALFDHYSGGQTTTAKVSEIFMRVKDSLPLNAINTDFGEVLGPVAITYKGVLATKGLRIDTSAQVYVPARPNEPLMDYGLYTPKQDFIISAKSGTTTNVVKPGDIIELLSRGDGKKQKKYSSTSEYAILQILADNSILLGPIRAVSQLYPNLVPPNVAYSVSQSSYDPADFKELIASSDYLAAKNTPPTLNEIMYACEKIIQKETREGSLHMNKIFADAIDNIVYYVKFELDNRGIGIWDSATAADITKIGTYGRIYLRTKNGNTRAKDRMGIQV
jgi:hypothetical protein